MLGTFPCFFLLSGVTGVTGVTIEAEAIPMIFLVDETRGETFWQLAMQRFHQRCYLLAMSTLPSWRGFAILGFLVLV